MGQNIESIHEATQSIQDKQLVSPKAASNRNLIVDALRGLCLVQMTIDHFRGNPFDRFSNSNFGPFGFFTAASGFVFLSGWAIGRAYGKRRQKFGDQSVIRSVVNRLGKVYLAQVILVFVFCLGSALVGNVAFNGGLELFRIHPLKGFLMGAALLYQPYYLGILPMYLIFLIFTPLILRQVQTGHSKRVVLWSAAIWVFSGLTIRVPTNATGLNFGFNPLTYQILFVIGVVIGDRQWRLESLTSYARRLLVVSSLALTALFFVLRLSYALFPPIESFTDVHLRQLLSMPQMGPLRLLNFAAFAVSVCWLFQQTKLEIQDYRLSRWLILLGQNSLTVFAWSVLFSYVSNVLVLPSAPVGLRLFDILLASVCLTIPALLSAAAASGLKRIPSMEQTSMPPIAKASEISPA
jgi:hypothetical protein